MPGGIGPAFANLRTKSKVLLGVGSPLLLLVMLAAVTLFTLQALQSTKDWVEHTYRALGRSDAVVAAAINMETGMRGFLLAGDDAFLEPFHAGRESAFAAIEKLKQTVSDNPAQIERLNEAKTVLQDWLSRVVEPAIALRREVGQGGATMDDIAALVGEARGKVFFDRFRAIMGEFQAEEQALLAARKESSRDTAGLAKTLVWSGLVGGLIIGGGLAWWIGGGIAGPIGQITRAMSRLADGDTTVTIPGTGRRDEIGEMAGAVQVFKDNLIRNEELTAAAAAEQERRARRAEELGRMAAAFDRQVRAELDSVTNSAGEMRRVAESMSGTAGDTSRLASEATSAAEQASGNVQTVASAAEQLGSSIQEISRQVQDQSAKAQQATGATEGSRERVRGLAEKVQSIGEVVSLITSIAEQTNLLALNATIEAARAGDAGKGFAVVASEVKNLANQTAKATEQVAGQIGAVQAETRATVDAIETIAAEIAAVAEIAGAIAAAVEQQNAATQEIGRNVTEAAQGTQGVTATVARVTEAAAGTGAGAGQVLGSAGALAERATALDGLVRRFLEDIQAA